MKYTLILLLFLTACNTNTEYKSSLYEANQDIATLASYARLPTCNAQIITKCKTKIILKEIAGAVQEYNQIMHKYSDAIDKQEDTTTIAQDNKEALNKIDILAHRTDILDAIQ